MPCHNCDKPKICRKILNISTPELLALCKQIKKERGISAAKLAEMAKVPVGTIERLFAKDTVDCKWETLRPVLGVLLPEDGCYTHIGTATNNDLIEKIEKLREENNALKDKLLAIDPQRKQDIIEAKAEERKKIDYLLANDKRKNKIIGIMGALLFLTVVALVISLGMDSLW